VRAVARAAKSARDWRPACGRKKKREDCADVFATGTHGPRRHHQQDEVARVDGLPGEARGVHPRVYADAEEAEFGAAESGARAADERGGSDHVHSGDRAQLARALDRAGARGPREGSAGSALPHRARNAGRRGRREPQARTLEVRREAAEGGCGSEVVEDSE